MHQLSGPASTHINSTKRAAELPQNLRDGQTIKDKNRHKNIILRKGVGSQIKYDVTLSLPKSIFVPKSSKTLQ